MSNPNAAGAEQAPAKTPSYAWPCLIVSLLAAVSIVFSWMWLPGLTFPVFKSWLAANNPLFADPSKFGLLSNVMGLVPIGALIMALPTTIIVRKFGAKVTTLIGMGISLIGTVLSALTVGTNFYASAASSWVLAFRPPSSPVRRASRSGSRIRRAAARWPSGPSGRLLASSAPTS